MKYKGIYWVVLSSKIKKSLIKRFGIEVANKAIKNGKGEYRKLLQLADDLGKGNPMASNAYFAYVFVGVWLGSNKTISPKDMSEVMKDVLYKMKPFFRLNNLNTKRGSTKWYRTMKKYEKWCDGKLDKFPTTWEVKFDENLHKDGSYYYFTRCPICSFCNRIGIPEIMPYLCQTDELMFKLQHGKLYRKCTLAAGDSMCDYWVYGDKIKNPE